MENNYNRRNFIRVSAVTGLGLSLNLYSCTKKADAAPDKDDDDDDNVVHGFKLSGVSLPSNMDIEKDGELKIIGKGFETGDKVVFRSLIGASKEYILDIKSISDEYIILVLTSEIVSGGYRLTAKRGSSTANIGQTAFNIVFNANIPDKENMTVKGSVYAEGIGLANVVVSDGFEVTKTDEKGVYYLASAKKNGYVFISIPGNYEVAKNGSAPMFFSTLIRPKEIVEIKDFELTPANNEKHVVLALGDMHLANRNNDIKQFQTGFVTDINQTIRSYEAAGTKVYAIALGDMTWETYWYTNNYALPDYRKQMDAIKTTMFHTIGNHDNDPYIAGDWESAKRFREILGPNYYSFNLGKVHYIVLDNVEYLNNGGAPGKVGERNYNATISADQMDWLKKDLATIEDKSTPIVLAMHIQLNSNPSLSGTTETSSTRISNADDFISALSPFSTVHLLTGHTHIQYNVENSSSLMEHNSAAVCATWWWTGRDGYAGNHLCKDGSPGGYGVWEMENKNLKWHYKSIGYNKDYQFRAYDLNKVLITLQDHAPGYDASKINPPISWATYARGYQTPNTKNEVLINVWNYDTKWKVEVTEDGTPLEVTRVRVYDPLHVISYNFKRLNVNAVPTADFATGLTAHMFKVKASSDVSTLKIKVTDRFGKEYTEDMVRPKAFGYLMT